MAATGYVEDVKGNLLLVKTHTRGWDAAGGHIEIGENLEEGVLREILEESGIKADVRCLVGVYSNVSINKVNFDFICDYIDGQPTPSEETSKATWIPKTEVLQYITNPTARYRFEKVLNFNGKICYSSYATKPKFQVLTDRYI